MPIYPFFCRDCRKAFEIEHPITQSSDKRIHCPRCKGKNVDRIWSPVSVKTTKKS
jgi:putative FmdB family regulatory protein